MDRKLTEWNGSEFIRRGLTPEEESVRDQDHVKNLERIANPVPFRDPLAEIDSLKSRLDAMEKRR